MKKIAVLFLIMAVLPAVAGAKVKLPAILSDNMVLQREADVNLWGEAAPGEKVNIVTSWNKKRYRTVTDDEGKWSVKVSTPEAGGPYSVRISDGETVVLDNILIGDVWICAGQSNMEMPVIGFWGQPVNNSAETIVNSINDRNVRFATVERQTSDYRMDDCKTGWCVPSMATTPSFSAIGYFFAKEVSEVLDIPIGVINVSWGSARMESFMTRESILKVEDEKLYDRINRDKAIQKRPEMMYNGMLYPIHKYTAKGFLWNQGAANKQDWRTYADLMVEMVHLWRDLWGDDSMPFYNVQVAPFAFGKPDNIDMALIIEAQYEAVRRLENAYMVPMSDLGSGLCPHYAEKDVSGKRTAMTALVKTYGLESELIVDPPVMEKIIYNGNVVSVYFSNDDYGLCPRYEPIAGFELAGEDRVFHPAEAKLNFKEKCVDVVCPEVSRPVAVRYAFRNQIRSNLTNTVGIPAYPFRSDRWDD